MASIGLHKARTIEQYVEAKRFLMRALREEKDPEQRLVYAKAVNYADHKIGLLLQARRRLRASLGLVGLLMAILTITGCNTVKGVLDDSAWLLRTAGENVQPHPDNPPGNGK